MKEKKTILFQSESGGTCLNMNWEEVSKGRVTCDPPDVCSSPIKSFRIFSSLGNGMEEIQLISIQQQNELLSYHFLIFCCIHSGFFKIHSLRSIRCNP